MAEGTAWERFISKRTGRSVGDVQEARGRKGKKRKGKRKILPLLLAGAIALGSVGTVTNYTLGETVWQGEADYRGSSAQITYEEGRFNPFSIRPWNPNTWDLTKNVMTVDVGETTYTLADLHNPTNIDWNAVEQPDFEADTLDKIVVGRDDGSDNKYLAKYANDTRTGRHTIHVFGVHTSEYNRVRAEIREARWDEYANERLEDRGQLTSKMAASIIAQRISKADETTVLPETRDQLIPESVVWELAENCSIQDEIAAAYVGGALKYLSAEANQNETQYDEDEAAALSDANKDLIWLHTHPCVDPETEDYNYTFIPSEWDQHTDIWEACSHLLDYSDGRIRDGIVTKRGQNAVVLEFTSPYQDVIQQGLEEILPNFEGDPEDICVELAEIGYDKYMESPLWEDEEAIFAGTPEELKSRFNAEVPWAHLTWYTLEPPSEK